MPTRAFVVGGAGFIGSHLVDALVARGPVTIYDNLSVGRTDFIARALDSGQATLIEADLLDAATLTDAMRGHDVVFHLAANPEARWGLARTRLDLEQGTIATYNVLEAMRTTGVPRLVFTSSGTVYGELDRAATEDDLGQLPISLYGASKLACEAMISAFSSCFGLCATIFRLGNVVGPRATHGAILDFLRKLQSAPDALEVLGDGEQAKPYLHVDDCVAGLLFALDRCAGPLDLLNLAPATTTRVARIAELCVGHSPRPATPIRMTGGARGWPGDVARSRMDAGRIAALGFHLRMTSDEAVEAAVRAVARELFAGAEAA